MFYERLQSLCIANGTDVSNALRSIGLSTSKGTAWKGGAIPKGDILIKLADRFNVSTDYLLEKTDDPTPAAQKEKPHADSGELRDDIRELIQLYDNAPAEFQVAALSLLKSAEAARKSQDEVEEAK